MRQVWTSFEEVQGAFDDLPPKFVGKIQIKISDPNF